MFLYFGKEGFNSNTPLGETTDHRVGAKGGIVRQRNNELDSTPCSVDSTISYHRPECYCLSRHVLAVPSFSMHAIILHGFSFRISDCSRQ